MDSSNKINVGASSSLIDLKAELLRKQQELKSSKSRDSRGGAVKTTKKSDILRAKSKYAGVNKGVEVRSQKDRLRIAEEERTAEKSKSVLEAKARIYDKMQKAALLMGSDDEDDDKEPSEASKLFAQSLVNFKQKAVDEIEEKRRMKLEEKPEKSYHETISVDNDRVDAEEDDDEWTEFTDSLGRTRKCLKTDLPSFLEKNQSLELSAPENPGICLSASADDRLREMKRAKWELEAEVLASKDKVHYQDVLYDELRTHGAGYYKFSRDEEERQKQMRDLKKLSEETEQSRKKLKKEKKDQVSLLKARLRKIKNKKRAKAGLPPLPESSSESEQEDEDNDAEDKKETDDKVDEKPEIRAWDVGKAGVFGPKPSTFDELDEKWLRDRRSDRNPEFAPPSSVYSEGGLRKKPSSSGASSHRQPIPATFTSSSYSGGNKYGNFVKSKDLSMPSSSLPATPVVIEPPPKPFLSPQNFWKQPPPKLNHPPPQKPIPIQDEMPAPIPETCEEFDRGRGTEIAPPATFSYYHGDARPKYQGRKIPFSDPDKVLDAVDAGLKALREQFETKKKTESSSSKDPREFQQFPSY